MELGAYISVGSGNRDNHASGIAFPNCLHSRPHV
jgi:hypothetical protein